MSLLNHCISRYTAGGIHIESYLVLVSSCNSYVVINRSVMIIIIRALPNKKRKERGRPKKRKKGKAQRKEKINKKGNATISFFPHLCFKVAPCSSCSGHRFCGKATFIIFIRVALGSLHIPVHHRRH